MTRRLWKALALAAVVSGCAGGEQEADGSGAKNADAPAAKTVYACNAPSENASNCVEWRGGAYPDEDSAKQECSANRGSYVGSACPAEDIVGRCIRHKGTVMEQHEVWYGPKMTAEAVQSACKGPDTEFRAS